MSKTPGQRWMGRVVGTGCIACLVLGHGPSPAQAHHIREGRLARNDFMVLPLCPEHHTGTSASVHLAKPELLRQLGVLSEFDLLALVLETIEKERL